MSKAIHCLSCNAVRSFNSDSTLTKCECGKVQGWYHDAENGLAVVYTPNPEDKPLAHVIGFQNGFLNEANDLVPQTYYDQHTKTQIPYADMDQDVFWRQMHQQACVMPRGPETVRVFDNSRRGCWAVIMTPGKTIDVRWATPEEARTRRR